MKQAMSARSEVVRYWLWRVIPFITAIGGTLSVLYRLGRIDETAPKPPIPQVALGFASGGLEHPEAGVEMSCSVFNYGGAGTVTVVAQIEGERTWRRTRSVYMKPRERGSIVFRFGEVPVAPRDSYRYTCESGAPPSINEVAR
jgi:hypothetical protein